MIHGDMLYFAYGSNMSPGILLRRCPGATLVGPATAGGWTLAFAGESRRWRGGVASIEPLPGARVGGVVWRLRPEDWRRLDRVEGVGRAYEKVALQVQIAALQVTATAYVKPPGTYVSVPTTRYVDTIEDALRLHGHDAAAVGRALATSRAQPARAGCQRLFVYGTLRRGQANARFLRHAGYLGLARSVSRFTLVNLGAYPGLVASGTSSVVGELYEVDLATLARLDALEGHPDFYVRRTIELDGGGRADAYLFPASSCRGAPRLLPADWCRHDS